METGRAQRERRLKLECVCLFVRKKIKEHSANLGPFHGSLKRIYSRVVGRANISSLSNELICITVCARVQTGMKTHGTQDTFPYFSTCSSQCVTVHRLRRNVCLCLCVGWMSHSISLLPPLLPLTSCRVTSMFQMTMPPSELQEMS